MPTPPTLDIERLLIPIAVEQPSGPELRQSADRELAGLFFQVRDARRRAVDAERRLRDYASMTEEERKAQPAAPESPDWDAVSRRAQDALARSKDLWIAAWLVEALTRVHGFAGLRDGILLAQQLCDRFWTDVHPQPEGGRDLTNRFAQFAGLDGGSTSDGTLIAPILGLPITAARTVQDFSLADYKDAQELARKSPEIRKRRIDQGAPTVDLFNQAVAETTTGFFRTLFDDLTGARQAIVDFSASLKRREDAQPDGGPSFVPPSANVRELLDECLRLCRASMKDETAPPAPAPVESRTADSLDGQSTAPVSGGDPRPFADATIDTRRQAIETLMRVSDFFRRTEPHSPMSYGIDQVVRWGHMSLPELLAELVSDKSAREEIFRRAGIAPEGK